MKPAVSPLLSFAGKFPLMEQVYSYSSSFTDDNYTILQQKTFFGKLQKTSWVGSTVDTRIDGRLYRFSKEGWLKPFILVLDKSSGKETGRIQLHTPFFSLQPRATITCADGQTFTWTIKGRLNRKWQWNNSDCTTIIHATEQSNLFSQSGQINVTAANHETALLGILGLYLRTTVGRRNKPAGLLMLVILIRVMVRLF